MAVKYKVVLAPFPFDDQKQSKVRPALCLTEPIGKFQHIVVAYISSQITNQKEESDIFIDSHSSDFAQTGLHVSSIIRLHRLMIIANRDIKRQLGELPLPLQNELQEKLRKLFFS